MKVHVNGQETELGGPIVGTDLRDSTQVLADGAELAARLKADGYLLLRGLVDRDDCLDTRRSILEPLAAKGVIDPDADLLEGRLVAEETRNILPSNWKNPKLKALTESAPLRDVFTRILGGPVTTYDFKWLRTVGRGFHTGMHWDSIYWEKGEVYSCWIPLGDVPIEQGPLAVLCDAPAFIEEAKKAPRELRKAFKFWATVDAMDIIERTGGRLQTTDFRAGDIVIFSMYTPHLTLKNQTDRVRTSVDVRYQLTSEPIDTNYMGENPSHVNVIAETWADLKGRDDLVGRLSN